MRASMPRLGLIACLFAVTTACASAGGSASSSSSSSRILTLQDVMDTQESDLYRAVERLRPNWLRARGSVSPGRASVITLFLDGIPYGTVQDLPMEISNQTARFILRE